MDEITQRLPHRPPFLFIDEIVSEQANSIHCQKRFTGDEDFFQGHFPGMPVTPGVLLCEAVFQASGLLCKDRLQSVYGLITRIKKAKFKHIVYPGDLLDIKVQVLNQHDRHFQVEGEIWVDNKQVLSIEFGCTLVDMDINRPTPRRAPTMSMQPSYSF